MKYILILFFFIFIYGCEKTKKESHSFKQVTVVSDDKNASLVINKKVLFADADNIEVISYALRYKWDTINDSDDDVVRTEPILKNKKLNVSPAGIKDRVILNEKLRQRLFNFLFIEKCPENYSVASCYDPRHCILFYNRKKEIFATIEVCLGCSTSYGSEGLNYNEMCIERMETLHKIFEDAGVKYFGENEKL